MKIFQRIQSWAKELKHDVLVLWFALKNPETPLIARAVAFITVAYALSPIDLIPDFVPILGYLDDLILIPIFIWITIKLVPDDVMAQSRKQAQEWLESNQLKPKSYLGLFIILLIWLLITAIFINYLLPGLTVTAKVELIAVEGKKLTFLVEAHDGVDLISKGCHERFVINKTKFDERVGAKKS